MNQGQVYTEKDWKLFRSKIAGWQENYMNRLNQEYIELLSGDEAPSSKFWALEERIKKDKKNAGVQVRMSRSSMIFNIISLINEGVIEMDDLEGFSEDLQEMVRAYTEME